MTYFENVYFTTALKIRGNIESIISGKFDLYRIKLEENKK